MYLCQHSISVSMQFPQPRESEFAQGKKKNLRPQIFPVSVYKQPKSCKSMSDDLRNCQTMPTSGPQKALETSITCSNKKFSISEGHVPIGPFALAIPRSDGSPSPSAQTLPCGDLHSIQSIPANQPDDDPACVLALAQLIKHRDAYHGTQWRP